MKGILLVSHADMCVGVLNSCEMIIGHRENIKSLSLTEEGVDIFRKELEETLDEMKRRYEEVIIVSDIPNATPYNECYRYILSQGGEGQLISGMNLAMVVELAIYSTNDMKSQELVNQVLETGRSSILKLEID